MACFRLLTPTRLIIVILVITVTTFILFSLNDDCTCATIDILVQRIRSLQEDIRTKGETLTKCQASSLSDRDEEEARWDPHVLCVFIPFRNRFEELMEFVPFMDKFLSQQKVRHRIVVINQIDTHRFNRASLLNIAFKETRDQCSYIALHDVDLLPRNPAITYHYSNVLNGPYHISSPALHPKYDYEEFIGGIMLMASEQFEKLDGLSNRFWGWGREDDELYMRIQEAHLKVIFMNRQRTVLSTNLPFLQSLLISRPQGITTGRKTFFHIHDKKKRKRDMKRIGSQHKESFKRDRATGLHNVQYDVRNRQQLNVNGSKATILHVKLECDIADTPWCDDS